MAVYETPWTRSDWWKNPCELLDRGKIAHPEWKAPEIRIVGIRWVLTTKASL
jgi:hypothetical protein